MQCASCSWRGPPSDDLARLRQRFTIPVMTALASLSRRFGTAVVVLVKGEGERWANKG